MSAPFTIKFIDVWTDGKKSTRIESATLHGRPVVVIDPSDRKQVERFRALYDSNERAYGHSGVSRDLDPLTDALREFADPTQPKLEEPTGLGAVVEDANGVRHVRTFAGSALTVWLGHIQDDGGERTRRWADIDPVKVLSEGVIA